MKQNLGLRSFGISETQRGSHEPVHEPAIVKETCISEGNRKALSWLPEALLLLTAGSLIFLFLVVTSLSYWMTSQVTGAGCYRQGHQRADQKLQWQGQAEWV